MWKENLGNREEKTHTYVQFKSDKQKPSFLAFSIYFLPLIFFASENRPLLLKKHNRAYWFGLDKIVAASFHRQGRETTLFLPLQHWQEALNY